MNWDPVISLLSLGLLGYLAGVYAENRKVDVNKLGIKIVCFSSLVFWILPPVGFVVGMFTITLGDLNKNTTLGKIYFFIGLLGFVLSFIAHTF